MLGGKAYDDFMAVNGHTDLLCGSSVFLHFVILFSLECGREKAGINSIDASLRIVSIIILNSPYLSSTPRTKVRIFRPCIWPHRNLTSPWISPGRPFRERKYQCVLCLSSPSLRMRRSVRVFVCGVDTPNCSVGLPVSRQQRERKKYAELFNFQVARRFCLTGAFVL